MRINRNGNSAQSDNGLARGASHINQKRSAKPTNHANVPYTNANNINTNEVRSRDLRQANASIPHSASYQNNISYEDPFDDLEIPDMYSNNVHGINSGGNVPNPASHNPYNMQNQQYNAPVYHDINANNRRGNKHNKPRNKPTAAQRAQMDFQSGRKPSLFTRMSMALSTFSAYIKQGRLLDLLLIVGDWIYNRRIVFLCIYALILLCIGFFFNRYISWGGGLLLVLIGILVGRTNDDREGFSFIITGFLIYLIPFLL